MNRPIHLSLLMFALCACQTVPESQIRPYELSDSESPQGELNPQVEKRAEAHLLAPELCGRNNVQSVRVGGDGSVTITCK